MSIETMAKILILWTFFMNYIDNNKYNKNLLQNGDKMVKCKGKKIVLSRKELSHVKRADFK